MAFTPEQEAALARVADRELALGQANDEKAQRVAAAKAALEARQVKLREDAKALDPKSKEYQELVAAGDAEVADLHEDLKREEAS